MAHGFAQKFGVARKLPRLEERCHLASMRTQNATLQLIAGTLVTMLALLSVASSVPAEAQTAAKVYRIGVMAGG